MRHLASLAVGILDSGSRVTRSITAVPTSVLLVPQSLWSVYTHTRRFLSRKNRMSIFLFTFCFVFSVVIFQAVKVTIYSCSRSHFKTIAKTSSNHCNYKLGNNCIIKVPLPDYHWTKQWVYHFLFANVQSNIF